MDWDRDRSYSRDDQQYAHRFPTPATCGGGTGAEAADLFSMEDLHRAILMFYFLVGRRSKRTAWITRPYPKKKDEPEFEGYVIHLQPRKRLSQSEATEKTQQERRKSDKEWRKNFREQQKKKGKASDLLVDAQIPPNPDALPVVTGNHHVDVCTALLEPAQSTRPKLQIARQLAAAKIDGMAPISRRTFKAVMGTLRQVHDLPEFDANLSRLKETVTQVDKFIPENEINDFIRSQEESEIVTVFRRANPDKEAELRPA
ncbi:hypothetical protein FOYG_04128 [Fusarium oxysporum NRRL 32931]|uniref:Uncharacterized protein n=1 Tax=Fusarium oxysporum NRRL 32931 TaxID=660029 RepID=W9IK62_FUSOX|nr:hypothetical protein FOYG_04128 [Fusarium oxysporum NRRL 32931]